MILITFFIIMFAWGVWSGYKEYYEKQEQEYQDMMEDIEADNEIL